MTNEEILQKINSKSIDNGFDAKLRIDPEFNNQLKNLQDFAKAFWGEEELYPGDEECDDTNHPSCNCKMLWKHHLQQMVLSEDPIEYLAKFL